MKMERGTEQFRTLILIPKKPNKLKGSFAFLPHCKK